VLVDEYVDDLTKLAWTKEAFIEFTSKRRAAILKIVKDAIDAV